MSNDSRGIPNERIAIGQSPERILSDEEDATYDEVITVFDGPLTISTQALGEPDGPRVFDQYFPFDTPYTYDPAAGNLLLEVASYSGPTGSLISDVSWGPSALYVSAGEADASTGFVQTVEKAMQFEFVVPEPSSLLLSVMGMVALLISSRLQDHRLHR